MKFKVENLKLVKHYIGCIDLLRRNQFSEQAYIDYYKSQWGIQLEDSKMYGYAEYKVVDENKHFFFALKFSGN